MLKIPLLVAKLLPMFDYICPRCRLDVHKKSKYCVHCGEKFGQPLKVPPKILKDARKLEDYVHKVIFPKISDFQRVYLKQYFTEFFNSGFEESGEFGKTDQGATSLTVLSNEYVRGSKYTLSKGIFITQISMYFACSASGAKILFGIYDDNSGAPNNLMCKTVEYTTTGSESGWITLNISVGGVYLEPGDYWLSWAFDTNSVFTFYSDAGASNTRFYDAHTYNSDLPDPSVPAGYSNNLLSIKAIYNGSLDAWTSTLQSGGTSTIEVLDTAPYVGDHHLRCSHSGGAGSGNHCYARYDLSGTQPEVFHRIYIKFNTLTMPDNNDRFYFIWNQAVGNWSGLVGIRRNSGILRWIALTKNGAMNVGPEYSSTPTINTGQWYCVQTHWLYHATTGYHKVEIDGTEIFDQSPYDTADYGYFEHIRVGLHNVTDCGSMEVDVDAVVVADTDIGCLGGTVPVIVNHLKNQGIM